MEKILLKDPSNRTGIFFRDLINEKLNGEKIRNLFLVSVDFHEQKKYSKERETLKQILSIYPASIEAKDLYDKSLLQESEDKRLSGNLQEKNGDLFSAIQSYLDSIKIYSENEKSKLELKNLRNQEYKNISKYKDIALRYYTKRDYENAEKIYNNILLIEPQDRQADGYSKISYNKKKGMEKYIECIRNNDKKCSLTWVEQVTKK